MKAAFRQFLDQAISYGTENYEPRTRRRLRFINSFVFIIITLLIGLLFAISIFLMLSGSTPFSFGNLTIVVTCLYISVVPFLHRFSDMAAPIYLLASSVVGQLYFQFNIGTAQAGHTFFIFGAASLPFIFGTERKGLPFFATLVLAGAYIVIDYYAPEFGSAIEDRPLFIIQTIKYLSMMIIFLAVYFTVRHALAVAENAENELQKERDRSEMLLQNILPDTIALRLKSDPDAIIADRHPDVAVLFADIVDFTPKAARLSPEELVQMLNRIFSEFDGLVETHGLEKIKTVGDAYMVVAGIPDPVDDSAEEIAELALAIQNKTRELSEELGERIEVRIGIHAGEAVAGVIGTKKFAYDVWGDTVNTAARMEAFGTPNKIQVTEAVKDLLQDRYRFTERGIVDIKGKGPMMLHFLEERLTS